MDMTRTLFLIIPLILALSACRPEPPPVNFAELTESQRRMAENALAGMEVAEGLEVALFASEPMVANPTNIAVDARGRVWVCEARNYRLPYNDQFAKQEKGDRVLILEDTNRDGKADKQTVFYQGTDLLSPLGIAVLGNKVYVSSSPTLQVFTDEDGDDRPDRRDTLFITEGGYDHDHGLHALIFGPDGRLYFNFGNEVHGLKDKAGNYILDQEGRPIRTQGQPYRQGVALRCDPDGSNVEVLGHNFRNPYELAVDAFGNVWQSDNDDDGNQGTRMNFLLEYGNYGYTDEMTGAGWRSRRIGWSGEIPVRHWHQQDPGSVPVLRYNYAGSPTGMVFYEGDLLPQPFQNQMLHCEALKNEVRAYPLNRHGAGFTADSMVIIKGQDDWFRPSDVAVAPDGSLLVSDWYDGGVGGHRMEDAGQGRIYRIAPKVRKYKIPKLKLNRNKRLKAAFLNPNQDVFYQASRRLEQAGVGDELLQSLWHGDNELGRARSLWMLARKAADPGDLIREALRDEDERFRVLAIRLARQLDGKNLLTYLRDAVQDESAAVRREAAIALRYSGSPEGAALWAALARSYDGKDRWYLEALGIGSDKHADVYMAAFEAELGENEPDAAAKDIFWRVRSSGSAAVLADLIKNKEAGEAEISRYFRAFHFKPAEGTDKIIAGLLELDHPRDSLINAYVISSLDAGYLQDNPAFRNRVQRLLPNLKGTPEWLGVVRSMGMKKERPVLLEMYNNSEDRALANEAIQAFLELGGVEDIRNEYLSAREDAGKLSLIQKYGGIQNDQLVHLWAGFLDAGKESFPVENALVNALGSGWTGQHLLFDWVRADKLEGNLKTAAVLNLMRSWDPEVRLAVPALMEAVKGKEGELPAVNRLVELNGYPENGKKVFDNICATCHQVGEQGIEFGPDLSQIGSKLAKRALYSAILYPSAGINFGYEGYLVRTKEGGVFSGYKEGETEQEITLRMMGGVSQNIARNQIAAIEPIDQSLMTANLQAVMGQQELVDLVEYLASLK